jgi:trehalose-6-phosphate synthase
MRSMRRRVREHDVAHWAATFLSTLDGLAGPDAGAEPEGADPDAGAEPDGDASTSPDLLPGPGAPAY